MKFFSQPSLACVKTPAKPIRQIPYQIKWVQTLASGFALTFLAIGTAYAGQCVIPAEQGNWRNNDADTRGLTRVEFDMECRDAGETVCNGDICTTTSAVEPHYFIDISASCSPQDCEWGREEGVKNGDWFIFNYNQGFATRDVRVRTYSQWPGWLRVWVRTDYNDSRADATWDYWFKPE